jgi:hypothetical protein
LSLVVFMSVARGASQGSPAYQRSMECDPSAIEGVAGGCRDTWRSGLSQSPGSSHHQPTFQWKTVLGPWLLMVGVSPTRAGPDGGPWHPRLLPRHVGADDSIEAEKTGARLPKQFNKNLGRRLATDWDSSRHKCSVAHHQRHNFAIQAIAKSILFQFQVVPYLQVEPKSLRRSKKACQSKGSIRCNRTFPSDNLIDSSRWNADVLCQAAWADPQGNEKFLPKNFAGVDWD